MLPGALRRGTQAATENNHVAAKSLTSMACACERTEEVEGYSRLPDFVARQQPTGTPQDEPKSLSVPTCEDRRGTPVHHRIPNDRGIPPMLYLGHERHFCMSEGPSRR